MAETAINVPFDSGEIIDIARQEFEKRLRGLGPLHGSKEYTAFALDFQVKIRLRRAGEFDHQAKETLAWGSVAKGDLPSAADLDAVAAEVETAETTGQFQSKDPNEERVERDMPLTVEVSDGKGGKKREKRQVRRAPAKKGE